MKIFKNKTFHKTIIVLISVAAAMGLSLRVLLSLPFFYEQTPGQKILTLAVVFLAFLFLIWLSNKTFILPNLQEFTQLKNILFIILLFIIIASTSSVSTVHYWSKPEKHEVEICFDSTDGNESLEINKLVEPKTNRLFSPKSFGVKHYPIIVPSGECLQGQVVTLYWRYPLRYLLKIMSVVVEDNPPDGRLFISVNDNPAVVYFDKDAEDPVKTEISFTEGFDQGEVLPFARNLYISLGIKTIALILSSLYLSLFLFGLTGKILNLENVNNTNENQVET
jgi:hypothetical protein